MACTRDLYTLGHLRKGSRSKQTERKEKKNLSSRSTERVDHPPTRKEENNLYRSD